MLFFTAQTNKGQDENSLPRKCRQSPTVPQREEGTSGEHGLTRYRRRQPSSYTRSDMDNHLKIPGKWCRSCWVFCLNFHVENDVNAHTFCWLLYQNSTILKNVRNADICKVKVFWHNKPEEIILHHWQFWIRHNITVQARKSASQRFYMGEQVLKMVTDQAWVRLSIYS